MAEACNLCSACFVVVAAWSFHRVFCSGDAALACGVSSAELAAGCSFVAWQVGPDSELLVGVVLPEGLVTYTRVPKLPTASFGQLSRVSTLLPNSAPILEGDKPTAQ